jgi:hypothetical protein
VRERRTAVSILHLRSDALLAPSHSSPVSVGFTCLDGVTFNPVLTSDRVALA